MRSPSTIYLVTRTHGLRTHLLSSENVKTMAKSRNISEIVDLLMRSDYASEIGKLPSDEIDSVRLEKIFLNKLTERFFILARNAGGKARDFLDAYVKRIEVENIKRVLRAKHAQEKIEEHNLIPLRREYTLINFPALTEAKNVEEMVSLLRETVYAPLNERLDNYKRVELSIILESFLEGIYFGRVWERIKGLDNRQGPKRLVGEESDLRNLQLMLSMKMRNIAPTLIEEMSIPTFYRLRKERLTELARGRLEDAPGILAGTPYNKIMEEVIKTPNSAINLETVLSRRIYQNASFALRNLFLEFGYIVAYLLLCEREAKNLVTITTAIDLKFSEEDLQRRLFL